MNDYPSQRLRTDSLSESTFVPGLLASMSGPDLLLLRVKMGGWIAPEIEAELDRRAKGEVPFGFMSLERTGPLRIRRTHHRRRAPAA